MSAAETTPGEIASLSKYHAIRRGLALLVREWSDRLPPEFVGQINALVVEAIHEHPTTPQAEEER